MENIKGMKEGGKERGEREGILQAKLYGPLLGTSHHIVGADVCGTRHTRANK